LFFFKYVFGCFSVRGVQKHHRVPHTTHHGHIFEKSPCRKLAKRRQKKNRQKKRQCRQETSTVASWCLLRQSNSLEREGGGGGGGGGGRALCCGFASIAVLGLGLFTGFYCTAVMSCILEIIFGSELMRLI
jgi:hypothetical protein